MSFNSRLKSAQAATAATAITGAAPQTLNGSKLLVQSLAAGCVVAAKFTMAVKTTSLTMTPSIQGSVDGTNWDTIVTGTTTDAGTGSTVTTNEVLTLAGQPPYRYLRGSIVTAGATGTSNDTGAISWNYIQTAFA